MVKHIVMWRLKPEAEGQNRAENMVRLKEMLEGLNGRIPGLIRLEVGIDYIGGETSSDLVLYSELVDREALDSYQSHPEHQAVVPFVRAVTSERRAVDFDC